MNSMLTWIVLSAAFAPASLSTPANVHKDYGTARLEAISSGRPMAVFIGSGANNWTNIASETRRLLSEKFVCVFVDTSSPTGSAIADSANFLKTESGVGNRSIMLAMKGEYPAGAGHMVDARHMIGRHCSRQYSSTAIPT